MINGNKVKFEYLLFILYDFLLEIVFIMNMLKEL